jgi:dimethylhistidine N-methyltransferase
MAIYRNQAGAIAADINRRFYGDVVMGLSSTPKYLQSKYFYDAEGDRLFQQIMQLPEYYLTRAELEIFTTQTKALGAPVLERFNDFDVLELGAGDATKSTHLLRYLFEKQSSFTYYPIDISENVIRLLEEEMPRRIPGMAVKGLNGDYFDMIQKCYKVSDKRKLVLFLGSNIGNFTPEAAEDFLVALNSQLRSGDLLLIGFDLKKNPQKILAAYNDRLGITKAFNLNLLKRINAELDADFDLSCFEHYPTYDPVSGACKSYLISTIEQEIHIGDAHFPMLRNEPIWTELSQKYSEHEIAALSVHTGFHPVANFYDADYNFLDTLWEKA